MRPPLASVVVPTYNREADLGRCLEGWERQAPADLPFEVVVVDDGSTDGTADRVTAWRGRRFALRHLRQANAGPAAARNRALEVATGELVLFTGDDVEPTPTLLAEHWQGHRERFDPGLAILGQIRWAGDMPLSATMRHVDGVGGEQFSFGGMVDGQRYDFRHLYTANVSLRRELLDREPGGFSTEFPAAAFEDTELGWRLARHGLVIVYRASAVALHHHHYDAESFFRRQVKCGASAAVLLRLRPALARWTPLADLEWRRLTELGAGARRRQLVVTTAAELELWEARAFALAAAVEWDGGAPSERLLRALFRYGYCKGLATALLPGEPGRSLSAASFLDLLPRAVGRWADDMERAGRKVPQEERLEVVGLAGT